MEEYNKEKEIMHPELAREINEMAEIDQNMRKREIIEPGFWDDSIDEGNTKRMKEIISGIGWPTISKVGEEASTDAWILVQHADHDIEFQQKCLNLMMQEPTGEVALHDIAYLEDRIRVHSGRPQIYGTQFNWIDNKPVQDIEDVENVDKRRAEMGLKTLKENIEDMYKKYNIIKPE